MVPKLHIEQLEPSLYSAQLFDDQCEISDQSVHGSIAEALKAIADTVPDSAAHFVEVWYSSASIGMHSLAKLRAESSAVADQLVTLAAAVYQSEEELEQR